MFGKMLRAIQENQFLLYLGIIIVLGFAVRSYRFGEVPHGFAWDEAAIGYNGFAIFQTRRDEWLQRLPISFQSFGDYKAPLAIYANGVFTKIFGLTVAAVRLPFLLSALAMLIAFPMLISELWRGEKRKSIAVLAAAVAISTSPWHIQYSRLAFESGLALTFLTVAVFSFLRYRIELRIVHQFLWSVLSALMAACSLYSYHSAKVTVPVLFLSLAIIFRSDIKKRFWSTSGGLLVGILLILPLLKDSIVGMGLARANVTVFSHSDSVAAAIQTVIVQFFSHLHHQFLVLGQTTSLRHGDGVWGVLLPTTYVLVLFAMLFGIWWLISERTRKGQQSDRAIQRIIIGIVWLCAGILPAAIGIEVPHSNRALLALPGFLIVAVEGGVVLWKAVRSLALNQKVFGSHGETDLVPKSVLGTICMIHLLFSAAYIHDYFSDYAARSASAFSDGYIEAFTIAEEYEKGLGGKQEVDSIIFTSEYGQPYIYALFVRETNPIWYRGGSLIKYQFAKITESDLYRANALVVASGNEKLPVELADHIVYGSDGAIRFLLYKTPK